MINMKMKSTHLLFLGLLVIKITNGAAQFDHFWLVQVWPPGYCLEHKCFREADIFVIHGLWPVDSTGHTLIGTDIADNRTRNAVKNEGPLKKNLMKYWLSLSTYNKDSLPLFWIYEWEKHGSAQKVFPPLDYFRRAVELTKNMDLLNTLAEKDLLANGTSYHKYKYMRAILQKTGRLPVLGCVKQDGHYQLKEVITCVNKHATNFRSCNYKTKQSCGTNKMIKFLPLNSSGS